MERKGLVSDAITYIEMGAGRGTLSRTLKEAAKNARLLMVCT